jgi:hypothetical protein
MKLYEISNEIELLLSATDENGEINEGALMAFEKLNATFEEKAVSLASHIKNLEVEEEAIKEAILQMTKRKASLSNKAQRLSDYLQSNLERSGISSIKSSPYFSIKLKQCPLSVDVYNEESIPAQYWVEKTTVSLDKMAIKEDIKAGFTIEGAQLINKTKLEIK